MTKMNKQDYYNELGKYKFVASPEGNGIDCYRHYETWMSKGIPIIERNAFIQKKYQGLPILWTTDYSEINDSYLERCYSQFIESEFDFRQLLLSQYKPEIRKQILTISKTPVKEAKCLVGPKGFWNYSDYFQN